MTRTLFVFQLAACAIVACSTAQPATHARSWNAPRHKTRSFARTTIAAAVLAVEPPPPPPVPIARALAPRRVARQLPTIRLFKEESADCPTEAVGIVNERAARAEEQEAVARLKAKAAALGADAIVGYRTESTTKEGEVELAGVAVRCAALAEDRPYDTIETIEVPASSGTEDDAFDELLDRANKMHANLVLDVHLAPNGDGKKVVGAAIRYR